MNPAAPLFSIGVTTYDRLELLRETLQSVLRQDCTDVEILVGNDNPARILDAVIIGTSDPRVRIINHPVNLGEMGNMNALLSEAKGHYFSWLADDGLYAATTLSTVAGASAKLQDPPCVFTTSSIQAVGGGGAAEAQRPWNPRVVTTRVVANFLGCRDSVFWGGSFFSDYPNVI